MAAEIELKAHIQDIENLRALLFEKAEYLAKNTKDKNLIKFAGQLKNYERNTFCIGLGKMSLPVLGWGALYALFLITL